MSGMFGRQTGQEEKETPCGVVGDRQLEAPRTPRAGESSCVGGGLWPRSTFWGMIMSPALHVDVWPGLLKGVRVSEGNRGGAELDVIDPIEMDRFAQEKARRQGSPVEVQGESHPARLPQEEGEPAAETQAGEKPGQEGWD